MADIKLGLIGCGGIVGMLHLPVYMGQPEVEIVGLADPNADAIKVAKEPHDSLADVPEYANHRDLLDKSGANAVLISSPHAFHSQQMIDSLDAGCNVQTEKPAGASPADVEAAIAKRDATGKIVLVSYNRRFIPVYQGIVKALRDGKIGSVHGVSLTHTENWFERNRTTWRTVKKMAGGGFIMDTGAHTLDFIHHAIGKDPALVSARLDRMGSEVDVAAAVSFQFQDGPIGSVFTTGLGPAVAGYLWEDINFFGDKGAIMLRSVGPEAFMNPTVFWNDFESGETTVEANPDGITDDYFPGPGTNFVNAVMGRPTAEYATLEDALRVHKFVDAIYRSADAGGDEVTVF